MIKKGRKSRMAPQDFGLREIEISDRKDEA